MWQKFDKHSGIYRTRNKIDNLRLCVKLKTVNSLIKILNFEKFQPIENDVKDEEENVLAPMDGKREDRRAGATDDVETIFIQWQEKILSRSEIEFYSDLENCSTDLQKGYHQKIVDGGLRNAFGHEENRSIGRIFTYIDDDNFIYHENLIHDFQNDEQKQQDILFGAKAIQSDKIVRKNESREYKQLLRSNSFQRMYVLADLNPSTLLCQLCWKASDGILIVYPDFNDFQRNPYFLEIDTDFRYSFQYAIENVSIGRRPMTRTDSMIELEALGHHQPYQKPLLIDDCLKVSKIESDPSTLFNMPTKRSIRAVILFEIQNGRAFQYDNIHVRYKLCLMPKYCQFEGQPVTIAETEKCEWVEIQGSTHSVRKLNGIWKFGYCFEIPSIIYQQDLCDFPRPTTALRIYFEIISIDSWTRERLEGYSSMEIPLNPGTYCNQLRCFRIDYGFLEKIERFFIGGRRKFDYAQFSQQAEAKKMNFLNRYGLKAISTGSLNVRWKILCQKNPELFGECTERGRTKGMTLSDVVKAYQMARRRLEATT